MEGRPAAIEHGGKRILVVGGGPAGMMAAIAAAECGARVTLLERLGRAGVKLLATGGGRCNLTNLIPQQSLMDAFGRQGRFIAPALQAMGAEGLRAFFDNLGVHTHAPDGLHVFPASNSAQTVRQALLKRLADLDVQIRPGQTVQSLEVAGGRIAGIATASESHPADAVILAAGGKSYPSLGSDGSGFALAEQAGHAIIPPVPALVPLVAARNSRWICKCAGVSISGARVWIDLPRCPKAGIRGDVLITHTGLSGPAVLDLSGEVAHLLTQHPTVPLRLELMPEIPPPQWVKRLDQWQATDGAKQPLTLLSRFFPASLAELLCRQAGVDARAHYAHVTREQRERLATMISALPIEIDATAGFDEAMVTRGGVSLKQVDPRTLESKVVPGLYFAGEVLDLAGPCGGFNLQWAFSSGHLAGKSAAEM